MKGRLVALSTALRYRLWTTSKRLWKASVGLRRYVIRRRKNQLDVGAACVTFRRSMVVTNGF